MILVVKREKCCILFECSTLQASASSTFTGGVHRMVRGTVFLDFIVSLTIYNGKYDVPCRRPCWSDVPELISQEPIRFKVNHNTRHHATWISNIWPGKYLLSDSYFKSYIYFWYFMKAPDTKYIFPAYFSRTSSNWYVVINMNHAKLL
jgi:hypothetical protein